MNIVNNPWILHTVTSTLLNSYKIFKYMNFSVITQEQGTLYQGNRVLKEGN
jgi:hypothetical protein